MRASPQFRRGSIYIRIDHKGKQSLYKTEFTIEQKQWRSKPDRYGHRVHNHPMSGSINRRLSEMCLAAEKIWAYMRYSSPAELKLHLERVGFTEGMITEGTTIDFIQANQAARSQMNQASHLTLINHLKNFNAGIGLDEWTKDKVDEFQAFLWKQPKITSQNTVWGRIRDLRANLNLAMQKDLITPMQNPFARGYKVEKGGSRDIKLEIDEVKRLWDFVDQSRAVQVWFIAFLLDGARFNEVFNLTEDCIVNNRVEFEVSKKGHQRVLKSIPLTDKLAFLFRLTQKQKYPGNKLVGFFDKPAYKKQNARSYLSSWNAILNKELKVYARKAQVNRKISMHVARNTFAYMADKMGYSLVEIQDALKHSNVQVTRNYIGRLQNDRLDNKRNSLHNIF